jgi:hypothetical protein
MVCQQVITRFRIAEQVPPGGQRSFSEIAKSINLDEQSVTRVLRHAMTMRIFCEPTPGMVAHTNISKLLRTRHVHDWMTVAIEEIWPAAVKVSMIYLLTFSGTWCSFFLLIGEACRRLMPYRNGRALKSRMKRLD